MVRNPNERPHEGNPGGEGMGHGQGQAGNSPGQGGSAVPPDVHSWRERALESESGSKSTQPMSEQARAAAQRVAGDLKQKSTTVIDQQKGKLVEQLHHIGQALHKAGDSLQEQEGPGACDVAHGLAQRIDQAADFLDQRSVGAMADDLRHSLRRHPEIAIAGLVIGGVILARFLKSSADRQSHGGNFGPGDEGYLAQADLGARDDITDADESGSGRGESMTSEFDIAESSEFPTGRSPTSHGPAGPERPPQASRPAIPPINPGPEAI
jgi:hypothetical protein